MSNISVALLIAAALAAVGNFQNDSALSPGCKGSQAWITLCR